MTSSINQILNNTNLFLMRKASRYIPGAAWNTIWRKIDKQGKCILDVGCGDGVVIGMLCSKSNQLYYTGLDVYKASIDTAMKEARRLNLHCDFILRDIHKIPMKRKSFDIVLCLEVLEHLGKEDGYILLRQLEEIARRQVILSLPVGKFAQMPTDDKDNPYMEHQSAWSPKELISHGYEVKGYGLPIAGGSNGSLAHLSLPLTFIRRFIWIISTAFTYFLPRLAGQMICIRNLNLDSYDG